MLDKLIVALISMIQLLGRILTTPARSACAALCEEPTLGVFWANLAAERPWLRSISSHRDSRALVPVFARIPRDDAGRRPARMTRDISASHFRLR